jgi:hypothetical protein
MFDLVREQAGRKKSSSARKRNKELAADFVQPLALVHADYTGLPVPRKFQIGDASRRNTY